MTVTKCPPGYAAGARFQHYAHDTSLRRREEHTGSIKPFDTDLPLPSRVTIAHHLQQLFSEYYTGFSDLREEVL